MYLEQHGQKISMQTSRGQFTFDHWVPRNSWYSLYRPWKNERLSPPWSHPVVLNMGPLDWKSIALTTRPLLHEPLVVHLWVHIKCNKISFQTYKFLWKSSFALYCIKCFENIIPFLTISNKNLYETNQGKKEKIEVLTK